MGLLDIFKKKNESGFDLSEPEGIKSYVKQQLAESLKGDPVIDEDGVLFRQWNMRVCPDVLPATERGTISLDLYIEAPQWGRQIHEWTVAMGNNPKTRIEMALSSFVFPFMQGIINMEERREGIPVTTQFAGREHSWRVYKTDIMSDMSMDKQNGSTDPNIYWDVLKDDISKQLGDQKLCYVQVSGSRCMGDVTGDVYIDHTSSEELGDKVAKLVAQWDVKGYDIVSQRQFFFIRQEDDLVIADHR